MSVSQKKFQEVSQQMVAIIEKKRVFARDLGVAHGELFELEHFTNYRQDHKELEKKIRKVHNLAYKRELHLREKNEELATVRVEIDHLCGQFVFIPTL